ncbi:MAG: ABC transporter ATP-binding protein [Chloroflexi bacterium]|nr:ABC transporter ATP-binding protein [Chloroflexota bacterium]
MNDSEAILDVQNLSKSFGGLMAVKDCSISVRRGKITGLIGPNGAGKTTLFNLITGFLKPTSGHVFFEEQQIDGLPPHQIFRKGMVRTFQIPRELKTITVLENLMLVPAHQAGEQIWNPWFFGSRVSRQERHIYEQAMDVLKFIDLVHLRDEYASSLSGGQRKLLELGRTLMCGPRIILLDEPGAGVNRVLMRKLVDNIQVLCHDQGITFLVIEHDMDLVTRLCNPVIVMSEGRQIAEGPPEEIKQNEQVLEAYLGGQYR